MIWLFLAGFDELSDLIVLLWLVFRHLFQSVIEIFDSFSGTDADAKNIIDDCFFCFHCDDFVQWQF